MRALFLACVLVLADEVVEPAEPAEPAETAEGEEDSISSNYDIMKELEITLVAEILDGSSFTIRDKSSQARTLRIGNVAGHVEHVASLKKLLDRSMVLYKAWPDDKQTVPGEILSDVWTTEGMHIGLAMERQHGKATSGVEAATDYTKDVLQVAAEKDKQKSYKKLEEALKEQGEFEREQRLEAKLEVEKTGIDLKLVGGGVFVLLLFVYPIYSAVSASSSEGKSADARAAKKRAEMQKEVEKAAAKAKDDEEKETLRQRDRAAAKAAREEQEKKDEEKRAAPKTKKGD